MCSIQDISHFMRNFIKHTFCFYIIRNWTFFLISSLILCFANDIDESDYFSRWLYEFSYFKIFFSYKIMKDLQVFNILYSVHLYTFELSFLFEKLNSYFMFIMICSFPLLVSFILIFIFSFIYNKHFYQVFCNIWSILINIL